MHSFPSLFLILMFSFFAAAAIAQEQETNPSISKSDEDVEGRAWALYIENDTKKIGGPGSDQAYSAGIKISYIFAEERAPHWAEKSVRLLDVIDPGLANAKMNFGFSMGHQIYTPNNTGATEFIANDRPYAGWLYAGFAASFKEEDIGHFFELDLGVIGPSALGEQVQNNFHRLINEDVTNGWSHTLHDEPTAQFSYQKRFKAFKQTLWDFFPYYGVGFGNVQVGLHVGGLVRFGINLPDDFGPSRPSASDGDSFVSPTPAGSGQQKSYYAFAGARGNGWVKNIFLDGNTFQSSHHVKKYPFTFETEFGAGLQILPYSVVWRFVTRSPEFEERSSFNSFASLNFMYVY